MLNLFKLLQLLSEPFNQHLSCAKIILEMTCSYYVTHIKTSFFEKSIYLSYIIEIAFRQNAYYQAFQKT